MTEPTRPKLTQFRNCSQNEIMWIEKGNTLHKEGYPVAVHAGKSVWLTDEDIRIQKEEREDPRFVDGRLVEAGNAESLVSGEIRVRNDMTEVEMKIVVENLASTTDLGNKLKVLTSIATVNNIMDECERQDKPISYMKSCLNKVNALSGEMEIKLKNLAKDTRKKEKVTPVIDDPIKGKPHSVFEAATELEEDKY